mmetsp:Transcript_18346/g.32522  ORF Transcript_18346/g.32522 Transcript_18346/m.32522 type:complete len:95 (-) Transcript_18346:356-640(-)
MSEQRAQRQWCTAVNSNGRRTTQYLHKQAKQQQQQQRQQEQQQQTRQDKTSKVHQTTSDSLDDLMVGRKYVYLANRIYEEDPEKEGDSVDCLLP